MQQFNTLDASFLYLERARTPFHVSMIMIYDPSTCPGKLPTFDDIQEAVRVSLPVAEAFRRKIVRVPLDMDYPYWIEDEDFDLEYHMRHIALPKPGNWEQFRTQVSRLISRPLDMSRSPWELTVIDGLDNLDGLAPGCFAMVLKIHHCAIDGQSGVELINAIHQDSPRKRIKRPEDHWQPEKMPEMGKLISSAALNSIRRPVEITRRVLGRSRSLVNAAFNELRNENDEPDLVAPETIFNVPVSAHRTFGYTLYPLEAIKQVRHTVEGATVNDVCITVVAQALRRYLKANKALPSASLVTAMPISTRTPDQAAGGGNQLTVTMLPMFTDIADPIKRLEAITAVTKKRKAMQKGVLMDVLLDVVNNLPGALVGAVSRVAPLLVTRVGSYCNTIVTNVPGSPKPIYFLGAKLVQNVGTVPLLDGAGLLHAVGSYNGDFIFSFTACRDVMQKPEVYCDCIKAAADDVVAAAAKRQKARAKG